MKYPEYIHIIKRYKKPIKHLSGNHRFHNLLFNGLLRVRVLELQNQYRQLKLNYRCIKNLENMLHVKTFNGVIMKIKSLKKHRIPITKS